ncbi:hypothetical protein KAR91_29340 [Candidatus Pacearchaeota archaeon]|nr:hypothetical protein [Candidatus Pacearchaeota archaeon]
MPSPDAIANFQAFPHPLGLDIELVWTMPTTLPDAWRVHVLRREGADISDAEITSYFAGSKADDIDVYIFESADFPDITGFADYAVLAQTQYYYKAILQDASDDAVSTKVSADATENKDATTTIIDAKAFILNAIERVMENYGMVKDEHYTLLREYALSGMKAPVLYVTRVGGRVLHQYIGHFREVLSTAEQSFGELEMDNIQVVWEDPNAVRRDNLTNVFRETKEFIREYLLHPNGGDMEAVEILIEGDVINEAVRDRTQVGGMMMISCMISSSAKVSENLASWLDGLGEPQ